VGRWGVKERAEKGGLYSIAWEEIRVFGFVDSVY